MKYYTNPKHKQKNFYANQFKKNRVYRPMIDRPTEKINLSIDRPTKKVNLTDVILLLSFIFIFVLPFINLLIKTNF